MKLRLLYFLRLLHEEKNCKYEQACHATWYEVLKSRKAMEPEGGLYYGVWTIAFVKRSVLWTSARSMSGAPMSTLLQDGHVNTQRFTLVYSIFEL